MVSMILLNSILLLTKLEEEEIIEWKDLDLLNKKYKFILEILET